MTGPSATLHGDGVAPDLLARTAAAAGVPAAAAGAVPTGRDVVLFGATDRSRLTELMTRGCSGFVEASVPGADGAVKAALAAPHLYLSLSTATAWTIDCAAMVCDVLEARRMLAEDKRADVELALHEAVANAVIHGNLALGSSFGTTAESFDAFCKRLAERMEGATHGSRRISIAIAREDARLDLTVGDQGEGYDPAARTEEPAADARHGRGLQIVRVMASRVAVVDGGRSLAMSFDL